MKTRLFAGMKVRIDRPKGFVQTGKDKDGKPWSRTYKFDYGFIPKTQGGDGDGLDVFLGPHEDANDAFWVCQMNDKGTFDEYKVFLGFKDKASAKKAYFDHIPRKYYGNTITMTVQMMRSLLGLEPYEKLGSYMPGFWSELARLTGQ